VGSPGECGSTRRELLRDAGTVTVAVWAGGLLGTDAVAVAIQPGQRAFLTDEELRQLRALVDVFVPSDTDGGAIEGEVAEAVDNLLGAFRFKPPRIYAGAPFSDRAGHPENEFTEFLPLDRYERMAWRLRIEGSRGKPRFERNGPIAGWQTTYRDGLAALSESGFADSPRPQRERMLEDSSDPRVQALVDVAWPHTVELMYGAPEYGGNKDLLGWRFTEYQGDRQPKGWTREEIEAGPVPGETLVIGRLPLAPPELLKLAALGGSPELMHNLLASSGGSFERLRQQLVGVLESTEGVVGS
jgi:hypothetical protein